MPLFRQTLMLADVMSMQDNDKRTEYLKQSKEFISVKLRESLRSIVGSKQQWREDAHGLGLPGAEATELLHHWEWAHSKCSTFHGREGLVDQVLALAGILRGFCARLQHLCAGAARVSHCDASRLQLAGISGCVIGVSGAGALRIYCIIIM